MTAPLSSKPILGVKSPIHNQINGLNIGSTFVFIVEKDIVKDLRVTFCPEGLPTDLNPTLDDWLTNNTAIRTQHTRCKTKGIGGSNKFYFL